MENKNIVIVGGGYGGVACATTLGRKLKHTPGVRITLIDKNPHLTYTPLLYEVATGGIEDHNPAVTDFLEERVKIPYARMKGLHGRAVRVLQAEVLSINHAERTIQFKMIQGSSDESITYDYLVLALGGEVDFFGIPGLAKHALTFTHVEAALEVREHIVKLVVDHQRGQENRLDIMVGGGGPTGVEFAAELGYFFKQCLKKQCVHAADFSITLVEALPRLMNMLPASQSSAVKKRLEQLGVRVFLDSCLKNIDNAQATIAPRLLRPDEPKESSQWPFSGEPEKILSYDLLIWAGGVRGSSLMSAWGFATDKKGRVNINEYGEVVGGPKNVYAIGDSATLVNPETKQGVPALAQSAIEQGKIAAENISRAVTNLHGRAAHRFHAYPTVVPLGNHSALAHFESFSVSGWFGWMMRRLVDLYYFLEILSIPKAFRLWFFKKS